MQNTYQDLITDIQGKNPEISGKLEGGKKFKIKSEFRPAGDQPEAIKKLVHGAKKNEFNQVLLGVSKSGSPAPNPITSFPAALNSLAFWVTAIVGDGLILFKLSDIMLIEKY